MYQKLLENVIVIGKKVGKVIFDKYNSNKSIDVQKKLDNSLVTEVDLLSNKMILAELKKLTPNIPIISEEEKEVGFEKRKNWKQFWLIDPLDGTKEFVNRSGEFSINIALIDRHTPILGVVVVPTKDTVYFALSEKNAYKQIANDAPKVIHISDRIDECIRVTISRYSGRGSRTAKFLEELKENSGKEIKTVVCGSTLKLCLVAEGTADIYPRFGNTWEWDTAAGQCILKAAGGGIIDLQGREFSYNTKESLKNSEFIALTRPSIIQGISLATI